MSNIFVNPSSLRMDSVNMEKMFGLITFSLCGRGKPKSQNQFVMEDHGHGTYPSAVFQLYFLHHNYLS